MNSREILPGKYSDDDTYKVLDISLIFLQRFFGHSDVEAQVLMKDFFERFSHRFNEDTVHHDSSYRMAVYIQYLSHLKGNPDRLGHWMIEKGFNQTPPEASEFFRDNYFQHN